MPTEEENVYDAMNRLGNLLGRQLYPSDDWLLNIVEVLEKQQEQINDYLSQQR